MVYWLSLSFLVKSCTSSLCYFAYEIFLLIVGGMLKYYCDVIAALIEFDLLELSDITVLNPQEFINLKTWYGHYDCVQMLSYQKVADETKLLCVWYVLYFTLFSSC
jgi:hypothetical protein